MTVDFDSFMVDLEPDLPMMPIPAIERRLREAAIEACEDASVWRYNHPEIQILKGQREYELTPLEGTDVHSILAVYRSGRHLEPTREIQVIDRGCIALLTTPAVDSELLDSLKTTNRGLYVTVTLKPSRTGRQVSTEIFRDHHKMLIDGTLSKAYDMQGQAWSNPEMAMKHRASFERGIAEARRARERGYVTGSHRIRGLAYAAPNRR